MTQAYFELVGGRKMVALLAGLLLAVVVLALLFFVPKSIPSDQLKLIFDFTLGLIGVYTGGNAVSNGIGAIAAALTKPATIETAVAEKIQVATAAEAKPTGPSPDGGA